MVKNFEQTVRKSAQLCKIEIARGYLWGKVNQTNMDAQKVLFWYVSAYLCQYERVFKVETF